MSLMDTTVMPSLPGLLSLSLLLFCPVAELRTDPAFTEYTGALAGCGTDDHGNPLYPDEDVEHAFDVPFTIEDLMKINKIRFVISITLGDPEQAPPAELVATQKRLRALLMELLEEGREHRVPAFHRRLYRWGCVPEERILYPEVGDAIEKCEGHVYPMHKGVVLSEPKKLTSEGGRDDEEEE